MSGNECNPSLVKKNSVMKKRYQAVISDGRLESVNPSLRIGQVICSFATTAQVATAAPGDVLA